MSLRVKIVSDLHGLSQFIRIRERITAYREMGFTIEPDHPANYDPALNPVHQHLKTAYFIVFQDSTPIGRIAAVRDFLNPDPDTGFFGCFECQNNPEAASALFTAAKHWLSENGCRDMIGPATFNTNQQVGFLQEGSQYGPRLMLPYNPPYYCELAEKSGLTRYTELFAFGWSREMGIPPKITGVAARARKNNRVSIRPLQFRRMLDEALLLQDIFNNSMSSNWGFIPLTTAEALSIMEFCRQQADPDLLLTLWLEERPAGLLIFTPVSLAGAETSRSVRMSILAVSPRYRRRGLEACMIEHAFNIIMKKAYQSVDISMIHGGNRPVLKTVTQAVGAEMTGQYQVYTFL